MNEHLINSWYQQLEQDLKQIQKIDELPAQKLSLSFDKCKSGWEKLNEHILEHPLIGRAEEIGFAKRIRPAYCSLWLFCLEINRIYLNEPRGTADLVKRFMEEELQIIHRYCAQHAFYYHYYKSGATELDEIHFKVVSTSCEDLFAEHNILEVGPQPSFELFFTRFMALEKLQEYLLERMQPKSNELISTDRKINKVKPTTINLSVDQLGLLTRAADDARLLNGRSFRNICEDLAPHISTPEKGKISSQSLRSNAYLSEDSDKNNVIRTLEKMIDFIKGY